MGLQARHQPRPVVPFYLFVREAPFLDVDLDHTHQFGVKLPIDLLPQFSQAKVELLAHSRRRDPQAKYSFVEAYLYYPTIEISQHFG